MNLVKLMMKTRELRRVLINHSGQVCMKRRTVRVQSNSYHLKFYLIRKSFQNDEEWRLFYCDCTLPIRLSMVAWSVELCEEFEIIS